MTPADNTTLTALSATLRRQRLATGNLILQSGPFRFAIKSERHEVGETLAQLYPHHPICEPASFADFHVQLTPTDWLRRWVKPQVRFEHDGYAPFLALPLPQAFALLEWGMNWCIANYCHQYLMAHAAVVAKNDFAAILPAPPGSGKSTLCAALVQRGWRLLSDEITLVDAAIQLLPLVRPINLKNASIDIMRAFAPDSVFGPIVPDTKKGTVAHLRPPTDSVLAMQQPAQPRWIIFPQYQAGSAPQLEPMARHHAFLQLAENAFNYAALGEQGFKQMAQMVDRCDCYHFRYSQLDDAITTFDHLAEHATAALV